MTTADRTTRERLGLAGACCVTAIGAVLPLSTALMSLFTGLAFFFWLVSGRVASLPGLIRENAVARAALLLLALFIAGLFYTVAELNEALALLSKYRKLLLIAVLMLLLDDRRHRQWAAYAFFAGVAISLLVSFAIKAGLMAPTQWKVSILSPITHNTFMAFTAFWLAGRFFSAARYRWLWGIALGLATFAIFFINTGRTGYVICFALAMLFFWQRFRWPQMLTAGLLLVLMIIGTFYFSDTFAGRIKEAAGNVADYRTGKHIFTDVGIRLEWYGNSLELVGEKPMLGHGTGGFASAYAALAAKKGIIATVNPHNEYLNIGVQLGIVGVALFLYLFFVQWHGARSLAPEDGRLAQALVLTMALGCLANSFLLDSHEGHFYAFFSALLFAPGPEGRRG